MAQEQLGKTNWNETLEKRVELFPKREFDESFVSLGVGVVCVLACTEVYVPIWTVFPKK